MKMVAVPIYFNLFRTKYILCELGGNFVGLARKFNTKGDLK